MGQFEAILWIAPKQIERAARYDGGMRPLLTIAILLFLSGEAWAGLPDFNTDRFCTEFSEKRGGDGSGIGAMSKAVCLMSEESTKAVVAAAWDHVSARNQENCLKASGQSYVSLAQCLNTVPAQ